MKKFVDTFLIFVLIVLTIIAGKLLIKVNNEIDMQLRASISTAEESTFTAAADLEQKFDPYSYTVDETDFLLLNGGQASDAAVSTEAADAVEEIPTSETGYQSDKTKVQEVQQLIAQGSYNPEENGMYDRGRIDRRRQAKSEVLGINTYSNAKLELLDWWEAADKEFKMGEPATIIDVETEKSFNAVRTYGSNHADVETITAEDTAVMKEIWGGEWNWERRAVIVLINGKKLAASASGMPHAGLDNLPDGEWIDNRSSDYGTGANLDKIKGNNMDGHFDIHFLNSRTHGTDKVDDNHQQMVQKAFTSENK